ncbi:MAG: zf-HC2 domain-containing protein [Clostridia bacterium]|nr:zf-HC2 domain-containing protein [Clostridia bacterium]
MQETDCVQCRELLFDYVSGLTDDAESKAVAAHIESCPECRRELEFIESMLAAAAEIPEVPVPDEVREAVANRLSEAETEIKRERSRKIRRIVSAAAPVAAAVALTIGMYAGGVFDSFRNADEIMDGKPVSVEDSGGAAENKTAEPQTSDNIEGGETAEVNPDNIGRESEERQDAESGAAADSKGSSKVGSSSDKSGAEADKTEKAKIGNTESRTAENSDSKTKAEDAPAESPKQENNVSAPPAPEASETAEASADDAAVAAPSAYGAPRNDAGSGSVGGSSSGGSSGGGSSHGANAKNAATVAGTRLMSDAYAEVPKSCEIASDNAKAYAEKFGAKLTEGGCSFAISPGEWEDLRSLAANNGDSISTGEFVSADSIDTISVTVTER